LVVTLQICSFSFFIFLTELYRRNLSFERIKLASPKLLKISVSFTFMGWAVTFEV